MPKSKAARPAPSTNEAQRIALEILARMADRPRHASEEIAIALRGARGLGAEERVAVAEAVYAVLRQERFLDHALDLGGAPPSQGPRRNRLRLLASEFHRGRMRLSEVVPRAPRIDWLRVSRAREDVRRIADPVLRLGLTASIPDWLATRLLDELGEEDAFALAAAWNEPAPQTLRAQSLRLDRAALAARLRERGIDTEPTALSPAGLIVRTRTHLFRLPEFQEGLFEVQDEGSQLVSGLVAPPPRGLVIDACAGTGGKTLHLATLLGGRGKVVAIGVGGGGTRHLVTLRKRAERAQLHNIQTISLSEDASASWPRPLEKLVGSADRVLVDAPCSGLGVLRRNPEARARLGPDDITRLAELQRAILDRFAPLVRVGGRIVYATCSVLREENDEVLASFLASHPGFVPLAAKEILGTAKAASIGDGTHLRLMPHRHGTDGFFAAVLGRRG